MNKPPARTPAARPTRRAFLGNTAAAAGLLALALLGMMADLMVSLNKRQDYEIPAALHFEDHSISQPHTASLGATGRLERMGAGDRSSSAAVARP